MSGKDDRDRLVSALECIRPEVRAERPYRVGGLENPRIKLNQNESPFDLPPDLKQDLAERFLNIPANRYPPEQPWPLRDRLALSLKISPEQIVIGNGSNEIMHTLGLVLIEREAPVVVPRPMFSLYESIVRVYGGRVVAVPPNDDLTFDVDALVAARQAEQPPLTVVTSPNNPTGHALAFTDVERIVAAAPGMVVVDEAYWEFNDETPALALIRDYPNVIVIRTFSKAMGLAGVRLGYMVAHEEVIAEFMKVRLPFVVDRFTEEIGLAVLERPQVIAERVQRIKQSLRELEESLRKLPGVTTVTTSANFVLFETPQEPSRVFDRLASAGVLVRSMAGYPELTRYLRVTAGTASENKAFLDALEDALF